MTQHYHSFQGTAKDFTDKQVTINGVSVDAIGLCLLTRYGVAKVVGHEAKPQGKRGKAGAVYKVQGNPGLCVMIGAQ